MTTFYDGQHYDTYLFDLQQTSRVLVLGPSGRGRRLVVGDGDDVAGCGCVALVPLGNRGGWRREVGEEREATGTTGGWGALEKGKMESERKRGIHLYLRDLSHPSTWPLVNGHLQVDEEAPLWPQAKRIKHKNFPDSWTLTKYIPCLATSNLTIKKRSTQKLGSHFQWFKKQNFKRKRKRWNPLFVCN